MPSTMRASVLIAPHQLTIEERPVPEPGPGEVLLRVESAAVSGSDVNLWSRGRGTNAVLSEPVVLGRTASGTVVASGAGIDPGRVGQLVAIEPTLCCRHCTMCHQGRFNLCEQIRFLGTPGSDGAFREYLTLAADFAHPVPGELSADVAALIEPMSVGLAALRKAHVGAGSRVLVTGAGPIGLTTVAVAKALGATDITVTDLSADRLELAREAGATTMLDMTSMGVVIPETHFDAFIECSGSPAAMRRGFPAVRPAGRVVLVGRGPEQFAVPVALMQNRELTVVGSFRYANTFATAIDLAAAGMVDLAGLVGEHYGLDEIEHSLDTTRHSSGRKSIVHPGR
ncbi:alcohol dehydrogenase catalytic domain-containing protein [Naumannella sp. ID2617S]|uniref:NAD(P)-dependent alcohol dehydrogenase n=1 Tax=Enemella dayhoffiae TaxID=2016507 RepID=A0A255H8E4_9ACTN|nr:alcohol dehydrogenase catalytic domain-containing protein [Naumannella sp. ID2617S]OYO24010.1 NAD(P)-dependent alcohol dehydrogenase [Enemella dayhoffiae]